MIANTIRVYDANTKTYVEMPKVEKTLEQWKGQLTALKYYVTREQGTERPFRNEYFNNHRQRVYKCVCCQLCLFRSEDKFESRTGWPSFVSPIDNVNVAYNIDYGIFEVRTAVHCPRCEAHLGHVFDDGPVPTGKRYCMNSAALKFEDYKLKESSTIMLAKSQERKNLKRYSFL